MSVNSVLYANARVAALLPALLTEERFLRLIDAENGVTLLKEYGYTGATEEEMVKNQIDDAYAFLQEASPVPAAKNAFLKRNDYHNAKLFMKGKYSRKEVPVSLLYLNSLEDTVAMKDAIFADNYVALPVPMAKALEKIDASFAQGDRRSKRIDCLLTAAMYEDMLSTLSALPAMKGIVQKEMDFLNLSVLLRVRKHGLSAASLEEELLSGGNLSQSEWKGLFELSDEALLERLRFSGYAPYARTGLAELNAGGALSVFERDAENAVMAEYKRYRGQSESYLNFFGYVYARLAEVKNVRIVLAGKRASLSQAEIRERMRDLYV